MSSPKRLLASLAAHSAVVLRIALVVALVVGVAFALAAGKTFTFADEADYYQIAGNVSRGSFSHDGVHPTASRPPGFPIFLGMLRFVGFGPIALRLANVVLLVSALYLLYRLLRTTLNEAVALVTTCICALYPLLDFTAAALYPQTLGLVLMLVALLAFLHGLRVRGRRRLLVGAVSGFAWGALYLTVPALGLLLIAAGVVVMLLTRRRSLPVAAVALLGALILPGAWAARNVVVMKAIIPVSTNTGINFILGNSENTTVASGSNTDIRRYQAHVLSSRLSETAANDYFQQAAKDWVVSHPVVAVRLYFEKAAYNFAPVNDLVTRGQQSTSRTLLSEGSFLPFLALFLVRLALVGRYRPSKPELVLILLVVGNAFVQALTATRVRYRLPLDPLMIGVAVNLFAAVLLRWTPTKSVSADQPSPRLQG